MVLQFDTLRLRAMEVSSDLSQSELSKLLIRVTELLTPAVVQNLPPYFHHINSVIDAEIWFKQVVSESRLFLVQYQNTGATIGFLFAHTGEEQEAHIGYLLGEEHWGQGFAKEMLEGFMGFAVNERVWVKLIGGVDRSNTASSKLLTKLGFVEQSTSDSQTVFYEYHLVKARS